jgi:hypothetical protein
MRIKTGLSAFLVLLALAVTPAGAADTLRIYRLDGSKQCEEARTGRSLARDAQTLRRLGIPIRSMKKLYHPTMVNIMMCGATSTRANTYVIRAGDWRRHGKRLTGFKRWP